MTIRGMTICARYPAFTYTELISWNAHATTWQKIKLP